MCRLLGVSPSGYYMWRHRHLSSHAQKDAELTEKIKHDHQASRETYGTARLHADLAGRKPIVGASKWLA